jgi:O-acetyl-ADP-ribose deacetylase
LSLLNKRLKVKKSHHQSGTNDGERSPIAPGESVITPAFKLLAKYIIHTVCPRYIYGTSEEEQGLAMAYRSALSFKDKAPDASSIAFVSLGTGVYRWPLEIAAKIAATELNKSEFESTMMCVAENQTKEAYAQTMGNEELN